MGSLTFPDNKKVRLRKILNEIKQITESKSTQQDIKRLYEDILDSESDVLQDVSMFRQSILDSDKDIFYDTNIILLKNLSRDIESLYL